MMVRTLRLLGQVGVRRIDERIPIAVNRPQVGRLAWGALHLSADGVYVDGDNLLGGLVFPERGEDVLEAHGARRVLSEVAQQLEFAAGERRRLAGYEGVATAGVDDQIAQAEGILIYRFAPCAAPQVSPHPGPEGAG